MERAVHEMRERERKIPITEREYLWVQDDDKGEVVLHVGPTMVSPTASDRVVIADGLGGFKEDERASRKQPQRMIEVGDNQYVVLHNPLADPDEGYPNGKFDQGRNHSRPLRNGTRQMIPGPCSFHLRPGQRAEVRDAHELGSNQYVVVKVYGDIDENAPFYSVTMEAAARSNNLPTLNNGDDPIPAVAYAPRLTRGQQLVIRGIDTQFYIPPTGVDIVPDTSADSFRLTAKDAQELVETISVQQAEAVRSLDSSLFSAYGTPISASSAEPSDEDANNSEYHGRAHKAATMAGDTPVEQAARKRHRVKRSAIGGQSAGGRLYSSSNVSYNKADFANVQQAAMQNPQLFAELERTASQHRLVRDAVVLSEKEFCVIIDADGRRNVHRGPDRVFPGPYDNFLTEGSRNRIYDAFELLPHRALWLRVLTEIDKSDLTSRLPQGAKLEKDKYYPGDEIMLTGINAFFFPFNEIEVLNPESGQAFVGNDHDSVIIEAIGIDQKSGIYVRDLTTGAANLIRGKKSYLVNPAKEIHISRTVSAEDWNHWILANRPHKEQVHRPVTTPWALSIRIPNNMAILATSAEGQRVIEGPCVELLEYEEKLAYLELSTDTPKTTRNKIRTAFLRTKGNRVSDVIRVQTSDFVEIDVVVTYHVHFREEFKERWFNHENYVQVLVEHIRSLVRSHVRNIALSDFWPKIASTVRNVVLGIKNAETGFRPGRAFDENGMIVTEVEVLNSTILDSEISGQMEKAQRDAVTLQIGDQQAQTQLASTQLRAALTEQENTVIRALEKDKADLEQTLRDLKHASALAVIENQKATRMASTQLDNELSDAQQSSELERRRERANLENQLKLNAAEAEKQAQERLNEVTLALENARGELEQTLLKARAEAVAMENQSMTPGLVEAMTGLGDKMVLTGVAENMNLVSLFKGKTISEIFKGVLGGTRLGETAERIASRLTTTE